MHTVYVPADRFHAGLVADYGRAALRSTDEHDHLLRELLDHDDELLARVREKLAREPVEDLRIDLEDGYGTRPDAEEDGHVRSAARSLREAIDARCRRARSRGSASRASRHPPGARGVRTLALFLEELGPLPDGFVVTLPKVTAVEQVEALVHTAERLEAALGLAPGSLRFELQIETPQSILGPDGTALVARMIHAAAGRCTGLHYGTYDYSAFCGIAAAHQSLDHPVADHAKAVMQAAAAGTGVRLSDGSTNVLPVGSAEQVAGRVEQPPATRAQVPRARLLPGMGPAPGAAADPVRRHLRVLPRRLRGRRPTVAQLRRSGRTRECWTSRRRLGRWPTSCCAASTAAPCRPRRSAPPPRSTRHSLAALAHRTADERG